MGFILKVILFQIIFAFFYGRIRDISLKHYIKEKGYRVKRKPMLVELSDLIIGYVQIAIPFWGSFIILIMIFLSGIFPSIIP